MEQVCSFNGCTHAVRSADLCIGHYQQKQLNKVLTPLREYRHRPEAPQGFAYCNNHDGFERVEKFYLTVNGKPRNVCKKCQYELKRERELAKVAA